MESVLTAVQTIDNAIKGRYDSIQLRGVHLHALPVDVYAMTWLTVLDVSHNSLTALSEEMYTLTSLRSLNANCNEISSLSPRIDRLQRLECLALARNRLCSLPAEMAALMHLQTLNVSGNEMREIPRWLLSLPRLRRLDVVGNGILHPPRDVYLAGVGAMREFYCIGSLRSCRCGDCTAVVELDATRGVDCRYVSVLKDLASDLVGDADDDESGNDSCVESVDEMENGGDQSHLTLSGLCVPSHGHVVLQAADCRAFISKPVNSSTEFHMISLSSNYHPLLEQNELLVSPAVALEPHGSHFHQSQPAVIFLKHCANLERNQKLVAMCSDTGLGYSPSWYTLDQSDFAIHGRFIVIKTFHFSLFAVKLIDPYPEVTRHLEVSHGGVIVVPQVPGVKVNIPGTALDRDVSVTVKVLYGDEPGGFVAQNLGLVSPVVSITPHGLHFNPHSPEPVTVELPIPNYTRLCGIFGSLSIKLLYSPEFDSNQCLMWQPWHDNGQVFVQNNGDAILRFTTLHFSFFKTVLEHCASIFNKLTSFHVFDHLRGFINIQVSCKALMTEVGPDNSFSLTIMCYRFGTEPTEIGNYPIELGFAQRKTIRIGDVKVTVSGHFSPLQEVGQTTLTNTVNFDGCDFTTEFALKADECMHAAGVIGRVAVESQLNGFYNFDMNLVMKKGATDVAHLSRDSSTSISPVAEDTLSELEETLAKQLDGELTSECLAAVSRMLGLERSCDYSLIALLRQAKRQDISPDQVSAAIEVAHKRCSPQFVVGSRGSRWSTDEQDTDWDVPGSSRVFFPPTPPASSTPRSHKTFYYPRHHRKRKRRVSDDDEVSRESLVVLSEHLGDDWERLALHLRFSVEEIEDISMRSSSLRERSIRMLNNWHRRDGEQCTHGELYRALGKMRLLGLARHMEAS